MNEFLRNQEQNRVLDVVEQIQTAILEGQFIPDQQLPKKEELCKKFQTNSETLQEALRMLGQKSLVEIHSSESGEEVFYVKDANAELMAENLAMLIRSNNISLDHLTEFREGIEGMTAALAAQRATAADNKKLAQLIDEAARYHEEGTEGWNSLVQVDEKVHIEVAKIAGNPLYTFVLMSVHDNIHRYYDKFLKVGEMEMDENYHDLLLIVEAIADQDAEGARNMAIKHVRRFSKYMEGKKRAHPEW